MSYRKAGFGYKGNTCWEDQFAVVFGLWGGFGNNEKCIKNQQAYPSENMRASSVQSQNALVGESQTMTVLLEVGKQTHCQSLGIMLTKCSESIESP